MTAAEFAATYRPTADQVGAGTGIDPIALLAQWANETSWGTFWKGAPYNLANIRNGPGGTIITYASLDEFAQACIWTFRNARPNLTLPVSASNNYYWPVMAATNAIDQLAAIVASPWSAGHYGGSLDSFYTALEEFELTPQEHADLEEIKANVRLLYEAVFGNLVNSDPSKTKLDTIIADIAALPGGGGTEPPEPAEPTKGMLHVPAQDIPISFP